MTAVVMPDYTYGTVGGTVAYGSQVHSNFELARTYIQLAQLEANTGADALAYLELQALVPINTVFVSTAMAITLGGSISAAHGLGAVPSAVAMLYVCTSADLGYSPGMVVPAMNTDRRDPNTGGFVQNFSNAGVGLWADGTSVFGKVASGSVWICKTNGSLDTITPSKWNIKLAAWK